MHLNLFVTYDTHINYVLKSTDNCFTIFWNLAATNDGFIHIYINFFMHVRTLIFSQFLLHLKIVGRPVWILCDISILTGALFIIYFKALKFTFPLKKYVRCSSVCFPISDQTVASDFLYIPVHSNLSRTKSSLSNFKQTEEHRTSFSSDKFDS